MRKKEHFDNESINRIKYSGSTDSVLATLYKKILNELTVTNQAFHTLMENFLNDRRNGIPTNIKERSSARGNLRKELMRDHMTWKVFCKGLRFLNIPRFSIAICLYHRNGKKTFHEVTIALGDMDINSSGEDSNDKGQDSGE